jgi:hypothetical protein
MDCQIRGHHNQGESQLPGNVDPRSICHKATGPHCTIYYKGERRVSRGIERWQEHPRVRNKRLVCIAYCPGEQHYLSSAAMEFQRVNG